MEGMALLRQGEIQVFIMLAYLLAHHVCKIENDGGFEGCYYWVI